MSDMEIYHQLFALKAWGGKKLVCQHQ